ncbi:HAD family phosphatase [Ferrimicrobium sp.]|uniref:HAD family hydrolase n=1 Tax=Ferrimicrobium sp. TaxID=2926050 RepID=UPI0026297284|nr:HAD family phosphatase [Ferrimicrobium sp.]
MLLGAPVEAVVFDFNGTLSEDEPLLADLFVALAEEQLCLSITRDWYFEELVGLSDPEIVERLMQRANVIDDREATFESLLAAKVERYCQEVRRSPRITPDAIAFVKRIGELVPIVLVSGAVHEEVDAALMGAGLEHLFHTVVCGDDVVRGKPDPEGFEIALVALGVDDPSRVVVFEDSVAGLTAAQALGMWTVKVGLNQVEAARGLYQHSMDQLSLVAGGWLIDDLEKCV